MESKNYRGLSDDFMKALTMDDGVLNGFLEAVRKDDTLCLEIRRNYVNIYYRGGNLCRIKPKSSNYIMEFSENYAENDKHKEIIAGITDWDPAQWVNKIPMLKSIMDAYNLSAEREFQQLVLWENNRSKICGDTDYYIADIEYAFHFGDEKTRCRIDMVAVNWPSTAVSRKNRTDLQLALIEVKYGDDALKDVSGITEHIKDWHSLLSDDKKWKELCDDSERVFNQKIELGFINGISKKAITISRTKPPELILLIINHKPKKGNLKDEIRKILDLPEYNSLLERCGEIKIATASTMGYGLYIDCINPISKFLGE